jgi:hypothetical protein
MAIRAGLSTDRFAMVVRNDGRHPNRDYQHRARLAANPCLNRLQSQKSSAPPEPRRSDGLLNRLYLGATKNFPG